MTSLGKRVCADAVELRVPIRERETGGTGKAAETGDAVTSQKARGHQELEEARSSSLEPLERAQPLPHPDLGVFVV